MSSRLAAGPAWWRASAGWRWPATVKLPRVALGPAPLEFRSWPWATCLALPGHGAVGGSRPLGGPRSSAAKRWAADPVYATGLQQQLSAGSSWPPAGFSKELARSRMASVGRDHPSGRRHSWHVGCSSVALAQVTILTNPGEGPLMPKARASPARPRGRARDGVFRGIQPQGEPPRGGLP